MEQLVSSKEAVPAVVREAGPQAAESYLGFIARLSARDRTTMYGYRSAARRFLAWCHDAGLGLADLRAYHVADFLEAMRPHWKDSTARFYASGLRGLFAQLEADGVIERSPFAGVNARRNPDADLPRTLDALKEFLFEVGCGENSENHQAGLVAMYPVIIGGIDTEEIARVTGLPREQVDLYAGRLRENGIWTEDGKVEVDFEDPQKEWPLALVNLVLIFGCARGIFARFPAEEEGDASQAPNEQDAEAPGPSEEPPADSLAQCKALAVGDWAAVQAMLVEGRSRESIALQFGVTLADLNAFVAGQLEQARKRRAAKETPAS